jgi:chromosome partitioning protein
MSKTKVFSIATMKGGSGKSSVTMLLAVALATDKKKKVLIIDTDVQRTIGDWYENSDCDQSLVTVEEMQPRRVAPFLKRFADDYDVIFLDVPRITDKDKDGATVMLLYFCDGVLIPVIGSQVDVMATIDFLGITNQMQADQKADGFKCEVFGFINRRNQRKDNQTAAEILNKNGLQMFDSHLSDLKIFTSPDLTTSIMDTKEGRRRFEPFYNEFVQKYRL